MGQRNLGGLILPPGVDDESSRVNLMALLKQLNQRKASDET